MNKQLQLLIIYLALGITTTIFAQTVQSNFINYQGVASDASGSVMAEQSITVGIGLKYAMTGPAEYAENHSVTTDANGVFSLKIGNGAATTGAYNTFQWPGIAVFVTVSINGTEIGTTELLAVPYAVNAGNVQWYDNGGDDITNANSGSVRVSGNLEVGGNIQLDLGPAANEISIDGTLAGNSDKAIPTEKAVKTYIDANEASGLEAINEGSGIGWRLKGFEPNFYGPIGRDAVDLSNGLSSTHGATGNVSVAMGSTTRATGNYSVAMGIRSHASGRSSLAIGESTEAIGSLSLASGFKSIASGDYSIAFGDRTVSSGNFSTAMGALTKAESYASMTIGRYNIGSFIDNSGTNNDGDTNWIAEDPLFEIGNGTSSSARHNALTVLKNGKVGIGRHTPTSLLEVAHQDGTPSSSNRTNAFSIRNLGTGRSWQFYIHSTGFLELYNDGSHKGSFNPTSGAYNVVSDRRVKKDIIPLINGTLNKVMQLNPVSYLMIDQKDTKRNLGLISQEVKEIFPSITHYVKEQDLLTLSYTELIPVLIKALQEQQTIIEGQNANIDKLSADATDKNVAIETLLKRVTVIEQNLSLSQR